MNFTREGHEAEWNGLYELIKEDLTSKGVSPAKERKDFEEAYQYAEFLFGQYAKIRFDVKKIQANFERHPLIASFLSEIKDQVAKNNLEHPLIRYLNDERTPDEAKMKMRSLLCTTNSSIRLHSSEERSY